jgi:hypothetical protein
MDFHLLIFCTVFSSAMLSTWPNQFNLCYSDPSSGQKRNTVLVHSVIVHSMGSHIFYALYYRYTYKM